METFGCGSRSWMSCVKPPGIYAAKTLDLHTVGLGCAGLVQVLPNNCTYLHLDVACRLQSAIRFPRG